MINRLPKPALVTADSARPLPRLALWAFCFAYVLPGLLGRDPWKGGEITAYGFMHAMANQQTSWLAPHMGGLMPDGALLPLWIGASAMQILGGWIDPVIAARLPFVLLLACTLMFVWYASYHLALTDAAQPLPLAFGGEAQRVDYARAIADCSLLALIATLGLLRLGHESTPELLQLAAIAMLMYGLSASPHRGVQPRLAVAVALIVLSGSGAPWLSLLLGVSTWWICRASQIDRVRRFAPWVALATFVGVALAVGIHAFALKWQVPAASDILSMIRLWLWFPWPVLPLALFTLWRWRRFLNRRHISVPLTLFLWTFAAHLAMGGSDKGLLLALPGLAVLAAFALPTISRSAASAVDWFSLLFFSSAAAFLWLYFSASVTDWPEFAARNLSRLYPGFEGEWHPAALGLALIGTLFWIWLVKWRAGRHRHALWRSLVLPAGGVALVWLLLMTVFLPLLDHNRSYRPVISRLQTLLGESSPECIAAPGASSAFVGAMTAMGSWTVKSTQAIPDSNPASACDIWIIQEVQPDRIYQGSIPMHAQRLGQVKHPSSRRETITVYRVAQP